MVLRCIPLLDRGTGRPARVVLLRDISELRRRDRLLLSKDATIREIHHRVKNNLQTISSLLRLQGRRLDVAPRPRRPSRSRSGASASIALVHETLSREAGDDVPFVEIVRPLVRMVEEGLRSPDRPVRVPRSTGDAGKLPAPVATPLAVVLTELLQNVVDHAYPPGARRRRARPRCVLELANDGERAARARWSTTASASPEGFDLDDGHRPRACRSCATLVATELGGHDRVRRAGRGGRRPGTGGPVGAGACP